MIIRTHAVLGVFLACVLYFLYLHLFGVVGHGMAL